MASEQAAQLRQRGIAAAKAGDKVAARELLRQSLRLDPTSETGWIWLLSLAEEPRERLVYLQRLLDINPQNEIGLKTLASLGLTLEQLTARAGGKPVPPKPATPAAPPTTALPQSSTPIVDPRQLAQYGAQIDSAVRDYLAPLPDTLTWTHKTRGRAGERDALVLRTWVYAAVAGVAVLAVIIIIAVLAGSGPTPEEIAAQATLPPTPTWTPTPGATPTPSAVPTEPEITLTPTMLPTGVQGANAPYQLPAATDVYPPIRNRALSEAVAYINQGQPQVALPTLDAERQAAGNNFNASLYYYTALAHLQAGDIDSALLALRQGERDQQTNAPADTAGKALIDLGFAQIAMVQGQTALAENSIADAQEFFAIVAERAAAARQGDPNLALAYVLLAQVYLLEDDYTAALAVLDEGLAVSRLRGNVVLIVAKGELYLQQGSDLLADNLPERAALAYGEAGYQAFVAVYIDPTVAQAHALRIHVALAQGSPGLAVLYAQEYIFYLPGDTLAYKLLGDARLAEGNPHLALDAYSQAAAVGDDDPHIVEVLLARAALYTQRGEHELALDDLTRAYSIQETPNIQFLRMQAAYATRDSGRYRQILSDVEDLLNTLTNPQQRNLVLLIQARVLVDRGSSDDLPVAQSILAELTGEVSTDLQPVVDEYLARVYYALESYDEALDAINNALNANPTPGRYYLRGLIYEALEEPALAIRDFEWVLTWSDLYPPAEIDPILTRQERERITGLVAGTDE